MMIDFVRADLMMSDLVYLPDRRCSIKLVKSGIKVEANTRGKVKEQKETVLVSKGSHSFVCRR